MPEWPKHRPLHLAPVYWAETEASEDAKRLLEANPYRAVTLER